MSTKSPKATPASVKCHMCAHVPVQRRGVGACPVGSLCAAGGMHEGIRGSVGATVFRRIGAVAGIALEQSLRERACGSGVVTRSFRAPRGAVWHFEDPACDDDEVVTVIHPSPERPREERRRKSPPGSKRSIAARTSCPEVVSSSEQARRDLLVGCGQFSRGARCSFRSLPAAGS